MLAPTIHLNGDHRNTLAQPAIDAMLAVGTALHAISAIAPNGRNYYPQGPAAIHDAMREFRAMVAKLEAVHAELETLAIVIADGAP